MNSDERDYWFAVLDSMLRQGHTPQESLVEATRQTAHVFEIGPPRCEHGIVEGDWCEPCNKASHEARKANGDE